MLLELLSDINHHVRGWAAAHSLSLGLHVAQAENTLTDISLMIDIGIARLDAEMTLKVWREKGFLVF